LQQAGAGSGSWAGILIIVVPFFLAFYLFILMPQRRRQKQWEKMLGDLKTGDKVTTVGGITGTIIALRETNLHLRVAPDNLRIEVARWAVRSIIAPEGEQTAAK
jgi:preprotein translocase subunit YajC